MARKMKLFGLQSAPLKAGATRVAWFVKKANVSMEAELQKHGRKWRFVVSMWVGEILIAYGSPPAYNSRRNAHAGLKNWLEPLVDAGDGVITHVNNLAHGWRFMVDWGDLVNQCYASPNCYDSREDAEQGATTLVKRLCELVRAIKGE